MSIREYSGLRKYMRETGNLGDAWRHGSFD